MIKVGISGKIASGKSEVEKIIKNFGFKVFDLDILSKNLFEKEIVKDKIFKEFGTLDRKEIAQIVFNDINKKEKLEKIIYPELKKEILNLFERYKEEKAVFISGALLFKSDFYKLFDKTIYIDSDEQKRLERLMKRNNLSKEEALLRLNLQDDSSLADLIVQNNSSVEDLKKEVEKVLACL